MERLIANKNDRSCSLTCTSDTYKLLEPSSIIHFMAFLCMWTFWCDCNKMKLNQPSSKRMKLSLYTPSESYIDYDTSANYHLNFPKTSFQYLPEPPVSAALNFAEQHGLGLCVQTGRKATSPFFIYSKWSVWTTANSSLPESLCTSRDSDWTWKRKGPNVHTPTQTHTHRNKHSHR